MSLDHRSGEGPAAGDAPDARRDRARHVILDPRYNGPRRSANGGVAAGTFAGQVGGTAQVRLEAPPPLGTALTVTGEQDAVEVLNLERLIATARRVEPFVLEPPVVPTFAEAELARAEHRLRGVRHALSHCFVCGPERQDGLQVTPGPLRVDEQVLAAPFVPGPADTQDGIVREEVVWGALDCPSYPADLMARRRLALLGSITVHPRRKVEAGERMVVVGWTVGRSGRVHRSSSVLLDQRNEVVASAESVWIEARHQRLGRLLSRLA